MGTALHMQPPEIHRDPRFADAVAAFNGGDYFDASELFEDLFFEAVRDEVEFARAFLQLSAGMLHAERGQRRAAVQRLEQGLIAIAKVTNDRGTDLESLRRDVLTAVTLIRSGDAIAAPHIRFRG